MQTIQLLTAVTTNTTGNTFPIGNIFDTSKPNRCYQATVSGTGAVTATVTFFGSNDGVNWSATPFGTVTLSGTTTVTDNFASVAPWAFVRCVTASVSGTGATVTASVVL
jgi:hypothetical protein